MAEEIKISLAQIEVVKGDVAANLDAHLKMIAQSSKLGADLVVFPELSLTGYELELAQSLAVVPVADNFSELSQAAVEFNTAVIAGHPLKNSDEDKPTIGAVICFPDGRVEFYSKQHLHPGEESYCSPGNESYLLTLKGRRIGLAVCADFSAPQHAKELVRMGAECYIASALISEQGFAADARILSSIASQYQIPVLLSNHISPTGGWSVCGQNSVWDASGAQILTTGSKEGGCLIFNL
ncbi:carbon-nitrogen hydrolase family protein [Vibrio sp. H11]|uniref:carbon-nitrogen hydrolase family protein n=1 Tax=Vibrio sp. H11 TaxID=2565928 RepID=UPI0010A6704E|nr:carbon-nitrogen hydrolase family protein [Vibrio sp. H11]